MHLPQQLQHPVPSFHLREIATSRAERHRDAFLGIGEIADDVGVDSIRRRQRGIAQEAREVAVAIRLEQLLKPTHRLLIAGAGGPIGGDDIGPRQGREEEFRHGGRFSSHVARVSRLIALLLPCGVDHVPRALARIRTARGRINLPSPVATARPYGQRCGVSC